MSAAEARAGASAVYDTYWRFAHERHAVLTRRLAGAPAPWTEDPIIAAHKFTNAFRAADRTSQYLINEVIYHAQRSDTVEETVFRILLFKIFNKAETWEMLEHAVGPPEWKTFRAERYEHALGAARRAGASIYSAAYIMPSAKEAFGASEKHVNHLRLIERVMREGLPAQLARSRTMAEAYGRLREVPSFGRFLAYQLVTDVNYSTVTDFSEGEFVVAGPGARDGVKKCFPGSAPGEAEAIIEATWERQSEDSEAAGAQAPTLEGRRLQLIDIQNLYCETDKYARVAHPQVRGRSGRTQIKQKFTPSGALAPLRLPPKWSARAGR